MIPLGTVQMAINISRREFVSALGGTTVAWRFVARTQQPAIPVIATVKAAPTSRHGI
jgi:hypothetical protein